MQDTLLNLIPGACSPEVHLSQYDKGRVVPFKLADGKSAYDVPAGSAIVVKATKPSGLGFIVPVTFEGDTATMTITETMSNEYGRFPAELSITNGDTLIGTANFVFNVERSPHPEGTTDGDAETLIPELTLLVNEIRESNAKVESMTASATSLPAGSEPTAEYDSENNNLAFGIPTSEVTTEDLYKAFITKSASGSIASFSDGGDDLPMKSLKVNIVPKQSGSGDPSPSNVRPISGWDAVAVHISATTSGGSTITTNLGQTVYGGVLDVVSGKLNINMALVDLATNQSGSWYMASTADSSKKRLAIDNGLFIAGLQDTPLLCNIIPTVTGYNTYVNIEGIGRDANSRIVLYKSDLQTVADWKSWASQNGLKVAYTITPTEIQLTPTEVKSLLGSNNVWSESGSVEVEYRADTTLAYNELVAMILENMGN